MSSRTIKTLRYLGDVYDAVPIRIRVGDTTYVIAQDPLKPQEPKLDLPPVEIDPEAAEEIAKELGREEAPTKEKADPGAGFESRKAPIEPLREEQIAEYLKPLMDSLTKEIQTYLQAVGIQISGEIRPVAMEYDGLDLLAPLDTGNFSGLPRTELQFDFEINLPLPEGEEVEKTVEFEGGFFERLYGRMVYHINEAIKGTQELKEIIFYFCNRPFVAPADDAEELLASIAFLQNDTEARPGELASVPKEEATEEDKLEWLKAFINRLNEGEYMRFLKERVHKEKGGEWKGWKDSSLFLQLVDALTNQRVLTKQQQDTIHDLVDKLGDSGYQKLVQEAFNPSAEKKNTPAANKQAVVDAVLTFTKHEGYKGKVHVGTDSETGKIIARIDSPYPIVYIFSKRAGGTPTFEEASTQICNYTWTVREDVDKVRELLTVVLDLTEAAQNSVDEGLSKEREELSEEQALVRKVLKEQKKERAKKEQEEAPSAEEPPKEKPVGDEEVFPK